MISSSKIIVLWRKMDKKNKLKDIVKSKYTQRLRAVICGYE